MPGLRLACASVFAAFLSLTVRIVECEEFEYVVTEEEFSEASYTKIDHGNRFYGGGVPWEKSYSKSKTPGWGRSVRKPGYSWIYTTLTTPAQCAKACSHYYPGYKKICYDESTDRTENKVCDRGYISWVNHYKQVKAYQAYTGVCAIFPCRKYVETSYEPVTRVYPSFVLDESNAGNLGQRCYCFNDIAFDERFVNTDAFDLSSGEIPTNFESSIDRITYDFYTITGGNDEWKTTKNDYSHHSYGSSGVRSSGTQAWYQYFYHCPSGTMWVPDIGPTKTTPPNEPNHDSVAWSKIESYRDDTIRTTIKITYKGEQHDNDVHNNWHPTWHKKIGKPCLTCPKGTYSTGWENEGVNIKIGILPTKNAEEAVVCPICPNGYYQDDKGQTSCKKCNSLDKPMQGTDSSADRTHCRACDSNSNALAHFNVQSGECVRSVCPQGKYVNGSLALSSVVVTKAEYQNFVSNTLCIVCPNGYYQDMTAQEARNADGFAWGESPHASCKACPEGYSSHIDRKRCTQCPKGMITSDDGQENCSNCPNSGQLVYDPDSVVTFGLNELKATITTGGADACRDVKSPFYSLQLDNGSTIARCPDIGYLTLEDGQTVEGCTHCPSGYYNEVENTTSVVTCKKCPTGKYSLKRAFDQVCVECPESYYQDQEGQNKCLHCSDQTNYPPFEGEKYSTETGKASAAACKLCNQLDQDNDNANAYYCQKEADGRVVRKQICKLGHKCLVGDLQQCEAGKYQDEQGQSSCKNCAPGKYNSILGQKDCTQCERGRYQDLEGQSACKKCPGGTFMHQKSVPSKNVMDCESCPIGRTATETREVCEVCPSGFFQEPGTETRSCQTCNPGLFAPKDKSVCAYPAHFTYKAGDDYAYECDGSCISDTDGDGVCDNFDEDTQTDVNGCMDPSYCNFNPRATRETKCEGRNQHETCLSMCQQNQSHSFCSFYKEHPEYTLTVTGKSCVLAVSPTTGKCVGVVPTVPQSVGVLETLRLTSIEMQEAVDELELYRFGELQGDTEKLKAAETRVFDARNEYNLAKENCRRNTFCVNTCQDPRACNYCAISPCPFEMCVYPPEHRTCPPTLQAGCTSNANCAMLAMGKCLRDHINPNNELCDEEEVMGCMNPLACNFNRKATYQGYKVCNFPPPFRKCALVHNVSEIELANFISATNNAFTTSLDKINNITTRILNKESLQNTFNLEVSQACEKDSTFASATYKEINDVYSSLGVNVYSVAHLRQFFLKRAGTLQNSTHWEGFFQRAKQHNTYDDSRDTFFDSALATCALKLIQHQNIFDEITHLKIENDDENATLTELTEDLEEANLLQTAIRQAAIELSASTLTETNAKTEWNDAKISLAIATSALATAEVREASAKSNYDNHIERIEEYEAEWTTTVKLLETQQAVVDALPVSPDNLVAFQKYKDEISDLEKAQVEKIVEDFQALVATESQIKTTLEEAQGQVEQKYVDMTEAEVALQSAELVSAERESVEKENRALYEAALTRKELKQIQLGLSKVVHPCIHDKNKDNVCDEQDPHLACVSSGACNRRDEGYNGPAVGKDNCVYCEWGKYTESVCTDGTQTFKSLHTYSIQTGETELSGDCENPLVATDWLNQYDCVDCPAGWFGEADNRRCSKCPVGTYQDEIGKAGCKTCSAGKKQTQELGATQCNDCDADHVPPYGNDVFGECELCDPALGKFLNIDTGLCEYIVCPRGKGYKFIEAVGDEPATGVCVDCVEGVSYSSTASHLPCQMVEPCSDGYGGTFAPQVVTTKSEPKCIDEDVTTITKKEFLSQRINICIQREKCDELLSALNTGLLDDLSNIARSKKNFNARIGMWNTARVVNMEAAFYEAQSFNQDIGAWETGSVTTMASMFRGARSFNHNLESWDTSSVESMSNMFQDATAFNQDLPDWNLKSMTNAHMMFSGAINFNGRLPNMPVLVDVKGMLKRTLYDRDISHLTFPKIQRSFFNESFWNSQTRQTETRLVFRYNYHLSDVLPDSYRKLIIMPDLVENSTQANKIDFRWTRRRLCRDGEFAQFQEVSGYSKIRLDKSIWICTPHKQCDYDTQWMSYSGTQSEDVECRPLTDCTGGTFFIREKTKTSDRVCVDFTKYFKAKHKYDAESVILSSMGKAMLRSAHTNLMSLYPCTHKYGFLATTFDCTCGSRVCQSGTFCRAADSQCLTSFGTLQTPYECGDITCNPGTFCIEDQSTCLTYKPTLSKTGSLLCRDNPDLNEADCVCTADDGSTNNTCQAEQYCRDGECSDTPFCPEVGQYNGEDYSFRVRNENVCKCGDNACRKGEACDSKFKICTSLPEGFCSHMNPGPYYEKFTFLALTEKPDGGFQKCNGHCTSDDDCSGSLKCFVRSGASGHMAGILVPGCKGHYLKNIKANFCFDDSIVTNLTPLTMDMTTISYNGNANSKLGKCHGQCHSDNDCASGLECWLRGKTKFASAKRDPLVSVPGCYGNPAAHDREYDWTENVWNTYAGWKVNQVSYCFDPLDDEVSENAEDIHEFYSMRRTQDGSMILNPIRKMCQCGTSFGTVSQWCDHASSHASDDLIEVQTRVTLGGIEYDICPFNRLALDTTRDPRLSSAYADGSKHDHEGEYQPFYQKVSNRKCACVMRDAFRFDDDCIRDNSCVILDTTADGKTRQCQPLFNAAVDVDCGHKDCDEAYNQARQLREEYRQAQEDRARAFFPNHSGGHCYKTYKDYFDDGKLTAMKTGGRFGDLSYYRLEQFRATIDQYKAKTKQLKTTKFMLRTFLSNADGNVLVNNQVELNLHNNVTEMEFYKEFPRYRRLDVFTDLNTYGALNMIKGADFNRISYTPDSEKFRIQYYRELGFLNLTTAREFFTAHHSSQSVRAASTHTLDGSLQRESEDEFHRFYLEGECAISGKHPNDNSKDNAISVLNRIYLNALYNDRLNSRYKGAPYDRQTCSARNCATHTYPTSRRLTDAAESTNEVGENSGVNDVYAKAEAIVFGESQRKMLLNIQKKEKMRLFRDSERHKARANNRYSGWCAPPTHDFLPELRVTLQKSELGSRSSVQTYTKYEDPPDSSHFSNQLSLEDYYEPGGKKIGSYHENECGRHLLEKSGFVEDWYDSLFNVHHYGVKIDVDPIKSEWIAGYCGCKVPNWNKEDYSYSCSQKCTSILDHFTCEGKVFGNIVEQYGYPQAKEGECEWVSEYAWCDMEATQNLPGQTSGPLVDKHGVEGGIFPSSPKPTSLKPTNADSMYVRLNGSIFLPRIFTTDDVAYEFNGEGAQAEKCFDYADYNNAFCRSEDVESDLLFHGYTNLSECKQHCQSGKVGYPECQAFTFGSTSEKCKSDGRCECYTCYSDQGDEQLNTNRFYKTYTQSEEPCNDIATNFYDFGRESWIHLEHKYPKTTVLGKFDNELWNEYRACGDSTESTLCDSEFTHAFSMLRHAQAFTYYTPNYEHSSYSEADIDAMVYWNRGGMTVCQHRSTQAFDASTACNKYSQNDHGEFFWNNMDAAYIHECSGGSGSAEKIALTNKPQRRSKHNRCWCQHEFEHEGKTHRYPFNCIDVDAATGEGRCRVRYANVDLDGLGDTADGSVDELDADLMKFALQRKFNNTYSGKLFEFSSEYCPRSNMVASSDGTLNMQYTLPYNNHDAPYFTENGVNTGAAVKCCFYGQDRDGNCYKSQDKADADGGINHFVGVKEGCQDSSAINYLESANFKMDDYCVFENSENAHISDARFAELKSNPNFNPPLPDQEWGVLGKLTSANLLGKKAPAHSTGESACKYSTLADGTCSAKCAHIDGSQPSDRICLCHEDLSDVDVFQQIKNRNSPNAIAMCTPSEYCLADSNPQHAVCSTHPLPQNGDGDIVCPDNNVPIHLVKQNGERALCQCGNTLCRDFESKQDYCHEEFNYCSEESEDMVACHENKVNATTVQCYCGFDASKATESLCDEASYCFGGICTKTPFCPLSSPVVPVEANCTCGSAGVANAGQYCVYDPNTPENDVIHDEPSYEKCTGDFWTQDCECGVAVCNTEFQKCREERSQCSKPGFPAPEAMTLLNGASKCPADTCRCGGQACTEDKPYCYRGKCQLMCADSLCDDYCQNGVCRKYDECTDKEGRTATDTNCTCGTADCTESQYCVAFSNLCKDTPRTEDDNPEDCAQNEQTTNECWCDSTACAPGQYCIGSRCTNAPLCGDTECNKRCHTTDAGSSCVDHFPCQFAGGENINNETCSCGTGVCNEAQFCVSEHSMCVENIEQISHLTTVTGMYNYNCTEKGCVCGTSSDCRQFCSEGVCSCVDENSVTESTNQNIKGNACKCGNTLCQAGERCYSGECNVIEPCADQQGVYPSQETACSCGDAGTCSKDQFCIGGTCSNNPIDCINVDQTVPMHYPHGCMCSEDLCTYGEYCNANTCYDTLRACKDDSNRVSSSLDKCLCGSVACEKGKFCVDGVCTDTKSCMSDTGFEREVHGACLCKNVTCQIGEVCLTRRDDFYRIESGNVCKDLDMFVVSDPDSANYYQVTDATIEECARECRDRKDTEGNTYAGFRHEHGENELYSNMRGMCYCMAQRYEDCEQYMDMKPYYQFDFKPSINEAGFCLASPLCTDTAGYQVLTSSCMCKDQECSAGQYCNGGTCTDKVAACLDNFGLKQNEHTCTCQDTECDPGHYCNKGVCSDERSTNYMALETISCADEKRLRSYEDCVAFCEHNDNSIDPGNCEVRDLVGEDTARIAQQYPRGCFMHTITGKYFWNSIKEPTNLECTGNNGYSCVCFSTDQTPACTDFTGLLQLESTCLCGGSKCTEGQYCYEGGCYDTETYRSSLQNENCHDHVSSKEECRAQCLAGYHHIDDVFSVLKFEGAACVGNSNIIFAESQSSPWVDTVHTGESCKDICLTKLHSGELQSDTASFTNEQLKGDTLPSPMYFTLQRSGDNSRSRCVCHKLSSTKDHECASSSNLYFHSTYDVYEVAHRDVDMSLQIAHGAEIVKKGAFCKSKLGTSFWGEDWTFETPSTGSVTNSADDCKRKCKRALESRALNLYGYTYNPDEPGMMYISNRVRGSDRKCFCHYPGRNEGSMCEMTDAQTISTYYDIIKYEWNTCVVQEVDTDTVPGGCSLDTNEMTYYYNEPNSDHTMGCEDSESHLCVCGPRNNACVSVDGKEAHKLITMCSCGTDNCTRGQYCHKDINLCTSTPACASTDGETVLTVGSCICKADTCSAGQYCDGALGVCLDAPICTAQDGFQSTTEKCTCTDLTTDLTTDLYTIICDPDQYCYQGDCILAPLCDARNVGHEGPCLCHSGDSAQEDVYCREDQHICLPSYSSCASSVVRGTPADSPWYLDCTSNGCLCKAQDTGVAWCLGLCYEHTGCTGNTFPVSTPSDAACSDNAFATEPCSCGNGPLCQSGQYCIADKQMCTAGPTCEITDGSESTSNTCQCGDAITFCEESEFCYAKDNKCHEASPCQHQDGLHPAIVPCMCGSASEKNFCSAYDYCTESGYCRKFPQCPNSDGTEAFEQFGEFNVCSCGTETCKVGEHCDLSQNLCFQSPRCQYAHGEQKNPVACECLNSNTGLTTECTTNQWCITDDGGCQNQPHCKNIYASAPNDEDGKCKCGSALICLPYQPFCDAAGNQCFETQQNDPSNDPSPGPSPGPEPSPGPSPDPAPGPAPSPGPAESPSKDPVLTVSEVIASGTCEQPMKLFVCNREVSRSGLLTAIFDHDMPHGCFEHNGKIMYNLMNTTIDCSHASNGCWCVPQVPNYVETEQNLCTEYLSEEECRAIALFSGKEALITIDSNGQAPGCVVAESDFVYNTNFETRWQCTRPEKCLCKSYTHTEPDIQPVERTFGYCTEHMNKTECEAYFYSSAKYLDFELQMFDDEPAGCLDKGKRLVYNSRSNIIDLDCQFTIGKCLCKSAPEEPSERPDGIVQVTSGSCKAGIIMTEEECAATFSKPDQDGIDVYDWPSYPPGCIKSGSWFFYNTYILNENTYSSNENTECDGNRRICLCYKTPRQACKNTPVQFDCESDDYYVPTTVRCANITCEESDFTGDSQTCCKRLPQPCAEANKQCGAGYQISGADATCAAYPCRDSDFYEELQCCEAMPPQVCSDAPTEFTCDAEFSLPKPNATCYTYECTNEDFDNYGTCCMPRPNEPCSDVNYDEEFWCDWGYQLIPNATCGSFSCKEVDFDLESACCEPKPKKLCSAETELSCGAPYQLKPDAKCADFYCVNNDFVYNEFSDTSQCCERKPKKLCSAETELSCGDPYQLKPDAECAEWQCFASDFNGVSECCKLRPLQPCYTATDYKCKFGYHRKIHGTCSTFECHASDFDEESSCCTVEVQYYTKQSDSMCSLNTGKWIINQTPQECTESCYLAGYKAFSYHNADAKCMCSINECDSSKSMEGVNTYTILPTLDPEHQADGRNHLVHYSAQKIVDDFYCRNFINDYIPAYTVDECAEACGKHGYTAFWFDDEHSPPCRCASDNCDSYLHNWRGASYKIRTTTYTTQKLAHDEQCSLSTGVYLVYDTLNACAKACANMGYTTFFMNNEESSPCQCGTNECVDRTAQSGISSYRVRTTDSSNILADTQIIAENQNCKSNGALFDYDREIACARHCKNAGATKFFLKFTGEEKTCSCGTDDCSNRGLWAGGTTIYSVDEKQIRVNLLQENSYCSSLTAEYIAHATVNACAEACSSQGYQAFFMADWNGGKPCRCATDDCSNRAQLWGTTSYKIIFGPKVIQEGAYCNPSTPYMRGDVVGACAKACKDKSSVFFSVISVNANFKCQCSNNDCSNKDQREYSIGTTVYSLREKSKYVMYTPLGSGYCSHLTGVYVAHNDPSSCAHYCANEGYTAFFLKFTGEDETCQCATDDCSERSIWHLTTSFRITRNPHAPINVYDDSTEVIQEHHYCSNNIIEEYIDYNTVELCSEICSGMGYTHFFVYSGNVPSCRCATDDCSNRAQLWGTTSYKIKTNPTSSGHQIFAYNRNSVNNVNVHREQEYKCKHGSEVWLSVPKTSAESYNTIDYGNRLYPLTLDQCMHICADLGYTAFTSNLVTDCECAADDCYDTISYADYPSGYASVTVSQISKFLWTRGSSFPIPNIHAIHIRTNDNRHTYGEILHQNANCASSTGRYIPAKTVNACAKACADHGHTAFFMKTDLQQTEPLRCQCALDDCSTAIPSSGINSYKISQGPTDKYITTTDITKCKSLITSQEECEEASLLLGIGHTNLASPDGEDREIGCKHRQFFDDILRNYGPFNGYFEQGVDNEKVSLWNVNCDVGYGSFCICPAVKTYDAVDIGDGHCSPTGDLQIATPYERWHGYAYCRNLAIDFGAAAFSYSRYTSIEKRCILNFNGCNDGGEFVDNSGTRWEWDRYTVGLSLLCDNPKVSMSVAENQNECYYATECNGQQCNNYWTKFQAYSKVGEENSMDDPPDGVDPEQWRTETCFKSCTGEIGYAQITSWGGTVSQQFLSRYHDYSLVKAFLVDVDDGDCYCMTASPDSCPHDEIGNLHHGNPVVGTKRIYNINRECE